MTSTAVWTRGRVPRLCELGGNLSLAESCCYVLTQLRSCCNFWNQGAASSGDVHRPSLPHPTGGPFIHSTSQVPVAFLLVFHHYDKGSCHIHPCTTISLEKNSQKCRVRGLPILTLDARFQKSSRKSVTAPSVWRYSGQALVTVRSQSEFCLENTASDRKEQFHSKRSHWVLKRHFVNLFSNFFRL